ncbi:hypothetical protein C2E23DRAFT_814655 [Lenzites betulinus]|nr:hypothetical protein C2E23DRAFT_814655 [Lenzites betulinus]
MSLCVGVFLILQWSVFVRLRVCLSLFRVGLVSVCGVSCCVLRSSRGLVAVVERFTVNPNYSSQNSIRWSFEWTNIYIYKAVVMENV